MNNSMEPNMMMQPNFFPIPNRPNCNCTNEIRRLENRIFNLEREVNRLRSRVTRIENSLPVMTPFNENSNSTNYNPNGYNLM